MPGDAVLAALPLAAARVTARRTRKPERLYWYDPVAWLMDRVSFDEGEHPTDYQLECIDALGRFYRASARGPHGLGKT
ncbi:MAG: hypothetical protein MUE82_11580, partial [Chloroflexi bacterium]|nr:hypothetical protein [Chloroflexota bacterium]